MYIGLAVVALGLLVVVIGLLLPKAHHASRVARFSEPPEAIFAAITGPQDWRGVVKTDLANPAGPRQWREQSGRDSITFEEAASEPPRLYRSRIIDKNLPFSGTWTWEITPSSDGACTCRITEDGEVYNPVFRFVGRFIIGHTKTIDVYLTALGKKFGAPVKIEE
jgi:hypothetical protein